MSRGTGPKKKRKQVMKGMTISGGQKRPTNSRLRQARKRWKC